MNNASLNLTDGKAMVFAIRWLDVHHSVWTNQKYTVCMYIFGFANELYRAVVDDFGNLVKVDK